jgi:hypothetical protein
MDVETLMKIISPVASTGERMDREIGDYFG